MGKVLWFTGLSGSGKTTIAEALKVKLEGIGKKVSIIDGDVVRNTINKHLGFSREDLIENNRVMAELARQSIADYVLVPKISPRSDDREQAKKIIGDKFIELFVDRSLQSCIERDVKGLYKKALSGEIPNFIGIAESNPYNPPENPDITINTEELALDKSVQKIVDFLHSQEF
ncbi:MAG: adenylyl-sulfate kinase [Nanoarchaeota archaeon]|nr:adenylyl-sulfate kinase [Nanoarchaeota archaeon]